MKKLSFILALLPVLFLSCSSPTTEDISEIYNSPAETTHSTEPTHTHTFQIQRLFYDKSFALNNSLIQNCTLYVEVSADGCTCTKCGVKYHTNEFYSYRIDGQYHRTGGGRNLNQTLFSLYRTMGYNQAQAAMLTEDSYSQVWGSLYRYYYSLGYEADHY